MSTLELKGGIIEMVAGVQNKDLLQDIYKVMAEIITQATIDEVVLNETQEKALAEDIALSYQSENLIDHEDVLQKMEKWGNR